MQEVAMQIVDVYHIGLQNIHLTQECLGSMRRRQSVTVKETSHQSVPSHTGLIANYYCPLNRKVVRPTP